MLWLLILEAWHCLTNTVNLYQVCDIFQNGFHGTVYCNLFRQRLVLRWRLFLSIKSCGVLRQLRIWIGCLVRSHALNKNRVHDDGAPHGLFRILTCMSDVYALTKCYWLLKIGCGFHVRGSFSSFWACIPSLFSSSELVISEVCVVSIFPFAGLYRYLLTFLWNSQAPHSNILS